jgi:hypothetical protein
MDLASIFLTFAGTKKILSETGSFRKGKLNLLPIINLELFNTQTQQLLIN